jgi:hypothetical protein
MARRTWPRRRWAVAALMVMSVAALCVGLYRAGVRDETVLLGWSALLVLYEWVFLWR